jgi:regulator of sigma E protease
MVFILNILIIVVVLGIVVFVHELGHLIACKLSKVFVEEFAIGMGPKLFSKKYGETIYSLRAFPIGGFNKIKGEEFEDEVIDNDPRSLVNQKPTTKLFIILSGVLMNLLLAIVIFYIILISLSFRYALSPDFEDFKPVVGNVGKEIFDEDVKYSGLLDDSPAFLAGIPEEGTIKTIDGVEIKLSTEIINMVNEKPGEEILLGICAEDICNEYVVEVSEEGKIGILIYKNFYPYVEYVGWQRPFVGFVHILNWGKLFGTAIDDMFTEAEETGDYEKVAMSVSGPVGLYVVIDHLRDMGWFPLVAIVADISLSIGIINLLPIPALDGGRAIMILPEVFLKKSLNRKVEAWAIQISFIFLILLIIAVLFKDIFYFEQLKALFQ